MVVSTVYKVAEGSTECVAFICIIAFVKLSSNQCCEKVGDQYCYKRHNQARGIYFENVGSQIASTEHSSLADAISKMNQEGYSIRDIGLEKLFSHLINCSTKKVIGVFSKHQGSAENQEKDTDQDSTFASTMVSAFDPSHQATREYMAITVRRSAGFNMIPATGQARYLEKFPDVIAKYEELGYQNTRLGIEKLLAKVELNDKQDILHVLTKEMENDLS